MWEVIKNTVLWGAALWWVEYLSWWKISSTILAVKDSVAWIISGTNAIPAISKTLPIIWKLAPFALAWTSIYSWYKETKKSNLWNWVERWLLTYGIPWVALTTLWLLTVPLSSQVLIWWLWMYSVKKLHKAIGESISLLKKSPSYLKWLPWKALSWVKKLKPKKWTPSTPPTT